MWGKIFTIHDISVHADKTFPFPYMFGCFLDSFRIADLNAKASMLEKAPENTEDPIRVPFLAALAHKLANDSGLDPPAWAFEDRCYLPADSPHVTFNDQGNLRWWNYFQSPPEFKHRNLFVGGKTLSRY
jgi:hypothetical protein